MIITFNSIFGLYEHLNYAEAAAEQDLIAAFQGFKSELRSFRFLSLTLNTQEVRFDTPYSLQ